MNTQPIEKVIHSETSLQLHSIFHTIQGEGPFTGTPAIFIRLAGCNLCCPGCDTDYTTGREEISVVDLASKVQNLSARFPNTKLAVITGGEPFRQNLRSLLNHLRAQGFYVQVETNGTLPPTPGMDWSVNHWEKDGCYIVCSPKTGKINNFILQSACAFKYVIKDGDVDNTDGLPIHALNHPCHPKVARPPFVNLIGPGSQVYVQPMDEKDDTKYVNNVEATKESALKHGYTLQLQTHKLIWVE